MADNSLSHLFAETVQVSTKDLTFILDSGEIDTQEPPRKFLLGELICKRKLGRTAITGSLKKELEGGRGRYFALHISNKGGCLECPE